ncbi:MAG: peptidylprolyl isomerase [Clostridia bacterium]|nr:peptidylprolyl isomerase [Clostridia bacterium]
MKKKLIRRIATLATTAVLCVGACAMFAGCSSNHPEVTITYTFGAEETEYKVTYTLSRVDAPNTVKHFLELADAGFYDGLCIHDYDSDHLYSGGYRFGENDALEAVDYFTWVKDYEKNENYKFTQSVWMNDEAQTPLYTVYGECIEGNGNTPENGRENRHSKGALVMYYTDKSNFNERVQTIRNDGGENDTTKYYKYNSATSLFYTYLGSSSSSLDKQYCVFGKVKDYDELQALLDAIEDYKTAQIPEDETEEDTDYSFTEEIAIENVNEYEPFDDLKYGDVTATYNTPVEMPIIIKSVKVNKY